MKSHKDYITKPKGVKMKSKKISAGLIALAVFSSVAIPMSSAQAAKVTTLTYSGPSTGNESIIKAFAAFEKGGTSFLIREPPETIACLPICTNW